MHNCSGGRPLFRRVFVGPVALIRKYRQRWWLVYFSSRLDGRFVLDDQRDRFRSRRVRASASLDRLLACARIERRRNKTAPRNIGTRFFYCTFVLSIHENIPIICDVEHVFGALVLSTF